MADFSLTGVVIYCNSDANIFFPGTPWGDAQDAEMIRDALETRNMPGGNDMTVTVGMQTCQTPDAPDAAVALASSRTTDGLTFPVAPVDKSGTTGAKQLVRYGLLAKNTTATDTTVRWAWAGRRVKTSKK